MGALGGPGIAAGMPSFADFDADTEYEADDEDLMKDAIVQVDMQVCSTFVVHSYGLVERPS